MPKITREIGGKNCQIFSTIERSKIYDGGFPTIRVSFIRNGIPFVKSGSPSHNETESDTTLHLFNVLRKEVMQIAHDAGWPSPKEIGKLFTEFKKLLN